MLSLTGARMSNDRNDQERLLQATQYIQHEVGLIAEIQKSLLPEKLPAIPGASLAASYKTFDRAGGDYYDVFPLSELERDARPESSDWLVMIADAAGHGPAAAVLMAVFHAVLYTFEKRASGPAQIVEYINRHLYERFAGLSLMTAFIAFYEPSQRKLTYANAGHPLPMLRLPGPATSVIELTGSEGLPLGVQPRTESNEASIILQPGQTLLLFTDGVPDERSSDNIPFGQERIRQTVLECGNPQQLINELNRQLIDHQGETLPEDDQTLLVLHLDS
jgi:sigma-B regulation protein RsbU (phosphoserine phosphatase)